MRQGSLWQDVTAAWKRATKHLETTMKRTLFACLATVAVAFTVPAAAQSGADNNSGPNSTGTPGVLPNNSGSGVVGQSNNGSQGSMSSNGMSNGSSSSMSGGSEPATCQGMMDQMNSGGSHSTAATHEMNLAKQAQAKGQEKTCMSHMRKAMQ